MIHVSSIDTGRAKARREHSQDEMFCNTKWSEAAQLQHNSGPRKNARAKHAKNSTQQELCCSCATCGAILCCNDNLHGRMFLIFAVRMQHNATQNCNTKPMDPPEVVSRSLLPIEMLYEDDCIAVVNKPEALDTIGEKQRDLQSMLPFILRPPASTVVAGASPLRLPRPVHRLDRATSGCVLVAKTKESMSHYSQMFASREGIQKSYVAIVFGVPKLVSDSASKSDNVVHIEGKVFSTVDYPIEGKDAVTLWRTVATYLSDQWGTISLVHLIPKTGRNHQLRRHLRYCLGSPIVGDAKHGGRVCSKAKKKLETDMGVFLCSNSLSFTGATNNSTDGQCKERNLCFQIPLPEKFYSTHVARSTVGTTAPNKT